MFLPDVAREPEILQFREFETNLKSMPLASASLDITCSALSLDQEHHKLSYINFTFCLVLITPWATSWKGDFNCVLMWMQSKFKSSILCKKLSNDISYPLKSKCLVLQFVNCIISHNGAWNKCYFYFLKSTNKR